MSPKKKIAIAVIAIALILMIFIVPQLSLVTSGDFVKPLWGRLECAPTDGYEGHQTVTVPKTGMSVFCGQYETTDSCKVQVVTSNTVFLGLKNKIEYTLQNNDGSGSAQTQTVYVGGSDTGIATLPALNSGNKYWIKCYYQSVPGLYSPLECNAVKEYRPWKIFRFVGGAKYEAKAENCCMVTSLNSRLPSKESVPACLSMTGGIGQKWVNYVDDWAYGPATNVYTYQDKQVYCTGAQLYDIATLQMKDGKLVKINPDYNSPDAPAYVNSIGNLIKAVECCPNEANCGDDFKWTDIPPEKECWSDAQCYNGGNPVPVSNRCYKTYSCQADTGKCGEDGQKCVDCTIDSACLEGYMCDLTLTNYGKCVLKSVPYCGNGICAGTETKDNCPSDCHPDTSNKMIYIWAIIIVGALGIIGTMLSMRNKKTAMLVSFGILVVGIIGIMLLMSAFKLTTADLSLSLAICGSSKQWWENIPVVGLFGCSGRLDGIVGIIGAVALIVLTFSLVSAFVMAAPWILIIPGAIGYLLGTLLVSFMLDSWYIVAGVVLVVFIVSQAIKRR